MGDVQERTNGKPRKTAPFAPSAWQMEQAMSVLLSTAARLREEDPELMQDERLFADMLEGETDNAMDVLDRIIRASIVATSFAKEAAERADAIADRARRYKARADNLRGCAFAALYALELPKLERPDFTASVRAGQSSVFVEDEAAVPDALCRFTRTPDKTLIGAALKAGNTVAGAKLLDGIPSLSVRTR
jgi:Siphovirus Gp157